MSQEALNLNDEYLPSIHLHATAIFNILNSHSRREEKQSRVIGTLLGYTKGGFIHVTDCFAVSHKERVEDSFVGISKDYHKAMYGFHQRINRKEIIVGWYATTVPNGPLILDTTSLIHEFYSLESKNPIHLVVDTNLTGPQFNIRGFISQPMVIGGQPLANMFQEIKVEVSLSEAEVICLNHMIHGQVGEPFSSPDILSTISTPDDEITRSTALLTSLLDKISKYLSDVVEGKRIADPKIGIMLSDILGSLQMVNTDDFTTYFDDKVQDMLMISYLSSLTKAQILTAEKLIRIL